MRIALKVTIYNNIIIIVLFKLVEGEITPFASFFKIKKTLTKVFLLYNIIVDNKMIK